MTKTICDVRDNKILMDKRIGEIIEAFEREYEVHVDSIYLDKIDITISSDTEKQYIKKVTTTIII